MAPRPRISPTSGSEFARVVTPGSYDQVIDDPSTKEWRIGPNDWEAAVADLAGPQLIVAGPGTGKTEFLARRAAHILCQTADGQAGVLLLTFSRRAATELLGRVEERLGRSTVQVPASTFHSFAYRVLEQYGAGPGGDMPSLLTGPEQVALVHDLLREEDPGDWPVLLRRSLTTQTMAGELSDFILRAREHLLSAGDVAKRAQGRDDWRAIPEFISRYDQILAARNRIDYGTLVARACAVLEAGSVAAALSEQFPNVGVDEFQDTTPAQVRIVELLSSQGSQVTVAADPSQSIYGFRGAEPANVARFSERFGTPERPARRFILERSFRVPEPILTSADRLRTGTKLRDAAGDTRPRDAAGRVDVVVFDQHTHEADWIAAELLREHVTGGLRYREMAVLLRTKRRLLKELARAFERRGIAHDEPQSQLSEHPATGLVLDCVRLAILDAEQGPEFELANRVARRVMLGPLIRATVSEQRSLLRLRLRTRAPWSKLLAELEGIRGLPALLASDSWATKLPAQDGFWRWWTGLPELAAMIDDPDLRSHRTAWASLAQVLSRLYQRDPSLTLMDYGARVDHEDFEATPLLPYVETDADRVTLTTMHQAKGLEFEVVFIADAVEGVLPDLRRHRSILHVERLSGHSTDSDGRLEEEIRLAYMAMTRARRRVVWTATQAGIGENQPRPSRFLEVVAGVPASELSPPTAAPRTPVTHAEAEAYLRSRLVDPEVAAASRLAAAAVLANPPPGTLRAVTEYPLVRLRGPDTGLVPDVLTLSPSQAQSYERCPRRYVLNRRLRIGDAPGPYAVFGTLIHRVLERVELEAMNSGHDRSTLDAALGQLSKLLPEYDFGGAVAQEAWRKRGEELLTRLYEHWPRPSARPIAIEHYLEMTLGDADWRGYADRIEEIEPGSFRVVDYKTSKSVPKQEDVSESLQLGFYALAVGSDPDLSGEGEVAAAESWHPLSPTGKPRVRSFSMGRLEAVRSRLIDISNQIRAENWQPKVGPDCDRCPVRILCDEAPEGRGAFVR